MLMKEISQSIAAFSSDAPTMDQLMSALRFEGMHHSEDQRWVALEFVAGLVSENATRAFSPMIYRSLRSILRKTSLMFCSDA